MRKLFSLFAALVMCATMWAGGGIFEAWLMVSSKGQSAITYDITKGISLGTIDKGSMDSVFIKVWKNNGTDISAVALCYKIDGGEMQEKACAWSKDLEGNNQEWKAELKINFLEGLEDGDHTIEMWCKATTNKVDCEEFVYLNNGGKNYEMKFKKGVPTYYLVGDYCNWNPDSTVTKAFEKVSDTLTVTIDSLFGGIKVIEGKEKDWNNSYGAYDAPYELHVGSSPYGMKQGTESKNFIFDADYKNAKFQIFMADKESSQVLHIRFVSGEKVEKPAPKTFDLTIIQDTLWTKEGGKVAAWAWESGKDGAWTAFATNSNDTLTLKVPEVADSIIFVRNAPEATSPSWTTWNKIEKSEIQSCDTFIITNWNEGSWCKRPCKEEFGILVNGIYQAAQINPEQKSCVEYMVKDVLLKANDSVQLYNKCTQIGWADGVEYMEGSYEFARANNKFVVSETDQYDFYFQLGSPDKLYVGKPVVYAKNNWEGTEWTWKQLTKIAPDTFALDSVIFGGEGLNINTTKEDEGAKWFGLEDIKYTGDTIQAKDTVSFVYIKADSTLIATLIGRPEKPATKVLTLYAGSWSDNNAKIAAWTWTTGQEGQWSAFFAGTNNVLTAEIPLADDKIYFRRFSDKVEVPYWQGGESDIWGTSDELTIDPCLVFYANGYGEGDPAPLVGEWCSPSSIDETKAAGKMQKFLLNDQMYLLINGVLYNANGARIK